MKIDLEGGENKLWVSLGRDINKPGWKIISCGRCVTNYEKFIKSIRVGKSNVPTFVKGARVQEYIEKCFASSAQEKTLRISKRTCSKK